MKLIKTREENLEENYLELHYEDIDGETAAVLERLRPALKYIEGMADGKKLTFPLSVRFISGKASRPVMRRGCWQAG